MVIINFCIADIRHDFAFITIIIQLNLPPTSPIPPSYVFIKLIHISSCNMSPSLLFSPLCEYEHSRLNISTQEPLTGIYSFTLVEDFCEYHLILTRINGDRISCAISGLNWTLPKCAWQDAAHPSLLLITNKSYSRDESQLHLQGSSPRTGGIIS